MIYLPLLDYIQLGNYLFQYAAGLSTGQKVAIFPQGDITRKRIASYPSIFSGIPIVDSLPADVIEYVQPSFRYHEFPHELEKGNWVIKGYYQSEKFFRDKGEIRRLFGPSKALSSMFKRKYGDWLNKPNVTGINVRHGKDYLSDPDKFPFVGHRYFRDCIARLPECQYFIVTSDDLPWCKSYFPTAFPSKTFYFVEGEPPLNDMYIMSLCRNNIISNGTFSWWGAWLNEHEKKRVFAPSQWFGSIVEKKQGRIWDDIYFEGVEVIDNTMSIWEQFNAKVRRFKNRVKGVRAKKILKIFLCPLAIVLRYCKAMFARYRINNSVLEVFNYDCELFRKYSGSCGRATKNSRIAEIVMGYHVIEKGLTMPRRRLDFGHEAVLHLIALVEKFEQNFGYGDKMVDYAVGVLKEYLRIHEESGFDMSRNLIYWNRVREFATHHANVPSCHQMHMMRTQFFADNEAPFPKFATSRHTCRHFNGELPLQTVEAAVKLAMTAPSACNRQHVRIHCVSSHEKRDVIYTLQNGNRGFGKDADKLLVVTSDLNAIRWNEERNDIFTNAGMFMMNLSYALHYYKVAHCILNWSVSPESDRRIHELLSIPENERVVALFACGSMPDEVDIAASPRKEFKDIFTNHD